MFVLFMVVFIEHDQQEWVVLNYDLNAAECIAELEEHEETYSHTESIRVMCAKQK